jgi:hypothetical protein
MNDQNARSVRLRYAASGALAAFAAVGVIAGASALAAKPPAKPHNVAAVANCVATKTPGSAVPDKTGTPPPPPSPQPFLNAVQRMVDNGTITAAEGQAVDREIVAGRIDPDTLVGFTQAQLQSVNQALMNAKRALVPSVDRTTK